MSNSAPAALDAKASCRSFKLTFPARAASVEPAMNDARTLGTVVFRGEGDQDPPTWLVAFNLTTRKQVAKLEGSSLQALDHGFLLDHQTLYSPRFQPIGKLAAPDRAWVKLGSTDRIALRDADKGEIILQSTTTAAAVRIPTGASDPTVWFALVASPDGARLYAIGTESDEGEVLVIDVAKGKILARADGRQCAPPATQRLQ